jgi:DNA-binding Xre family transcriptional regulator
MVTGGEPMKLNTWKIKLILAEKEMNQSDLAVKCGVNRQQINEILSRESCTLKTLGRIAKALDIPVAEIVKEE